jgi:hypothetical protein
LEYPNNIGLSIIVEGDFILFPPGGGLFSVLFTIVFVVVIGTIIFRAISGVKQWQSNNQQPVLTVFAEIVSKRSEVHRHTSNNNGQLMDSTSTSYFITFQVQSGDRMELKVQGADFGLLAEGDAGNLTFQGTRFIGFNRTSH